MKLSTGIQTALKVLVSVGILTVLVLNLNQGHLWKTLTEIAPWQVGVAILGYLFFQLLSAIRWEVLGHSMNLGGRLMDYYRYYLAGMFFNLFLPTAIGGDFGRAMMLSKEHGIRWMQAFLSILSERFTGLIGLLLYVNAGLWFIHPTNFAAIAYWVAGLLLVGALTFTMSFRWIEHHTWGKRFIEKFILKQSLTETESNENKGAIWPTQKALLQGILLSISVHGTSMLLQYQLIHWLHGSVPFLTVAAVYGFSGLASMIPVSLNGIGLREGAATFLLVTWGHTTPTIATAFNLIWLAVMLLATIPGGLVLLRQQLSFSSSGTTTSHKNG